MPNHHKTLGARFPPWCPAFYKSPGKQKKRTSEDVRLCWRYLFFRAVSSQVSWAEASLTSVFGMGTGGPSP